MMRSQKKRVKIILSIMVLLFVVVGNLWAKTTDELTKCACSGNTEALSCLEQLKEIYSNENKYSDFVTSLKGMCPGNKAVEPLVDYYIALTRYSQLKYLEDSKGWDEYFAKGNDYRDDITNSAQKAAQLTTSKDPVNIYSKLLLFQFHKDQQDSFAEGALTDLMSSALEYAQSGSDYKVIKDAADKLLSYDEKGRSKELYKIYAERLSGSQVQDSKLKEVAVNFYNDGKIELAENIYDIYIGRISTAFSPEDLTKELISIAGKFVYRDDSPNDPAYAEKIFKKIEELRGEKAFDEGLAYLRGFNLEKAKYYAQAKDVYVNLVTRFPNSAHKDKLIYKIGLIYTYILRDSKEGMNYFGQLAEKSSALPYALAGLYQSGLLKQWEGDSNKAKEYYDKLLQKIGDTDPDRLALTQERLNEITQNKSLDYNIKIGLDTALKAEYANLDMSKLVLKATPYQPASGQQVDISSAASLGPTGCLQVELQYLWSGDLGGAKPAASQAELKTSYKSSGTELIAVVLVTPDGISERGIDLVDVK